jgi:hypothetical protein
MLIAWRLDVRSPATQPHDLVLADEFVKRPPDRHSRDSVLHRELILARQPVSSRKLARVDVGPYVVGNLSPDMLNLGPVYSSAAVLERHKITITIY